MVHAMPRADGGTRLVAPPGWRRPAAGAAPPPRVPRPGGNKQQSERGTDNGHDGGAGHPQPPLDGMRTNVASPGLVVHRVFRSVHYAGSRTPGAAPALREVVVAKPSRRPRRLPSYRQRARGIAVNAAGLLGVSPEDAGTSGKACRLRPSTFGFTESGRKARHTRIWRSWGVWLETPSPDDPVQARDPSEIYAGWRWNLQRPPRWAVTRRIHAPEEPTHRA